MKRVRFPVLAFSATLLTIITPAQAQAQDEFNSVSDVNNAARMSPDQARRCAEERLRTYANEPYRPPPGCPVLQGGVSSAGIYEGGTVPSRDNAGNGGAMFGSGSITQPGGTAGIYGPPPAQGGVAGTSGKVLTGGVEGQGATGYPSPTYSGSATIGAPRYRGSATGGPRYQGTATIDIGGGRREDYTIDAGPGFGEGDFQDAGYGRRMFTAFRGSVQQINGQLVFVITALRPRGSANWISRTVRVPVRQVR